MYTLIKVRAPFWRILLKYQQIEVQELNVRATLEEFFDLRASASQVTLLPLPL